MRIFIIEDQFIFRKQLIKAIKEASSYSFEIVEVNNERSFFLELASLPILDSDLFIIDIDLNYYLTGIDLAENIRKKNEHCAIVFSTSFEDKVTEIVNRQILPLGYLVKGREPRLFLKDLSVILTKLIADLTEKNSADHKLVINYGNEKLVLNEADILYIATVPSQKNLLMVRYSDQELLIPGKLRTLKASLKSTYFIKNLKSFVLNAHKIERLYTIEGVVQFTDETVLELGVAGTKKVLSFLKAEGSYVTN